MFEVHPAYLDPGAGSILVQFLIGGAIGIGLFFRRGVGSILSRLRRGDKLTSSEPRSSGG